MSSTTNPPTSGRADDAIEVDPTWSATAMFQDDPAKDALGIRVEVLERGRVVLSMRVGQGMVNGFGITHGGMVFALADTAFAYACNEGATPVVAAGADIVFTRASRSGDVLTATAERRWLRGRNGLYDVTVADQRGDVVAEFRGRSFATDRPAPPAS
ncbi:hydroxyphenylacetyl-CoA thioesterase PaaI [Isoptericola sediminis]|nr:hydroxyphenylacetyl-CoA thioesterase PaaI [Isoptericola sediminis]